MRGCAWWALVLPALVAVQALAADGPLTEQEAVRLALERNPAVRAAQAEVGMARAQAGMARAERALQLSANALATASNMPNVVGVPAVMPQALLQSQGRASLDANAMLMVPLSTGGRLRETAAAAEHTTRAAQQEITAAEVQVAAAARSRFASWQAALAQVSVATDALTAQREATRVSEQLFAAGKIPQFDLLRNQAALAEAEQVLFQAQAEAAAGQSALAQVLALPAGSLPPPATDDELPPLPGHPEPAALQTRPDLQAAVRRVRAAEATVRARQASYRPQLYGVGMLDAFTPSNMGESVGVTVGVVAGLPILDGGRRRAEVEEARQALLRTQAERDALELQVRSEVQQSASRAQAARRNVDTAAARIQAAQAAFAVAQERYAAGRGTVVERLDALRALTEAQQSLVTARADYRMRLADLYQAMGIITPDSAGATRSTP